MDPATAERLAAAAVTAGGSRRAQVVHVGHLFRAHQKTGVSGRDELIALLETK